MSTHVLKEGDWENFIQNQIIPLISNTKKQTATICALVGDLGAGKTTFSKTFLKKLGVKQHVQSPTFSIINSYDLNTSPIELGMTDLNFKKVFHIDVYRIENINELEVLHFDEILLNPEHLIIIEWADKVKAHVPQDAIWIYFEHDTLDTRKVNINE